jgi:hypothetical protein
VVKGWGLPLHEPGVELLAAKLGLAAREVPVRRSRTSTTCLCRGLRAALGGYGGGVEANVEDFAQEALIKITGNLDSFRGES